MAFSGRKEQYNKMMNEHPEWFTYDQSAVERVQAALLSAYRDLWEVCERHGLLLFLTGGTTLGAIRHGGFIPWDDDIDLAMSRADFERLRTIFPEELGEKYFLDAPDDKLRARDRFPKVVIKNIRENGELGENLPINECLVADIFIIENVPSNSVIRLLKGLYCNFCEYAAGRVSAFKNRKSLLSQYSRLCSPKSYYTDVILGFIFSYRTLPRWNAKIDRVCRCGDEASPLCGTPSGRKHYFGEIYEKRDIFPGKPAVFAGEPARLFTNPEKYLIHLYGPDYMTPPPPEKREHHFSRAVAG